jgi:glycosyltransferase involved in cell wall biosynthesis
MVNPEDSRSALRLQREDCAVNCESKVQGTLLVLLSNVELGGIGVQARDQVGYLWRKGIATSLVLLNDHSLTGDLLAWYSEVAPTEFAPAGIESGSGIGRVIKYLGLFKSRPEKIFHFHCFSHEYINWHAVLAARLAGKKVVATLHHTVGWTRTSYSPSFLFQKLAWRCAHRLLVTTNAGKRLIGQHVPANKVEVVPCLIMPLKEKNCRELCRERLGVLPSDFVVTVVARLIPSKGLETLVKAVLSLRSSRNDLKLLIVGDGPNYHTLKDMICTDPGVSLLGRVADTNDILCASDLFALTSYEEGFGMVYAEAARHGLPSVASDLPQVKEVVVDGETGWLVDPHDLEKVSLAVAAAYVDRTECRRRGQNAKTYCQRFEPEAVMSRQIDIYEHLLTE